MLMKRYYPLLLIAVLPLLVSCKLLNFKKDPKEIFDEQKSGVVLICNEYYYDITLNNGEHLYFTGIDQNGDIENLTGDEKEVKKSPSILNGTGFFIDKTGRILTNRHVVAPEVDKATVKQNINAFLGGFTEYINSLQEEMQKRYQAIQEYAQQSLVQDDWGNIYTNLSDSEVASLRQEAADLEEQFEEAEDLKDAIRSNILNDNFSVQLHSHFGIAYDGSNVNSWDDFMKRPCTLLRVSPDANSDLALLQLNSKQTPGNSYIYDLSSYDVKNDDKLEINQNVYMIGYNHGVQLAKTNNGIRAQFTSGTITQQPDGTRVTYSIPAMQGSSGSPIVDDWGRLVAINFAGSNGSDNFNFGIPLMRVRTFLK